MRKLIKYLKKSVLPILAILVLLVVQAFCDLSLPEKISDIVNVGIQQGGIAQIAPMEIRKSQMERLFYFMDQNERDTVLANYTLHDSDKKENLQVYTLYENTDAQTVETLNDIFGIPMLALSFLESDDPQIKQVTQSLQQKMPGGANQSASLLALLDQLPQAQRQQAIASFKEQMDQFEEIDPSIVRQMAVSFVREEYRAVGIDVDRMQSNYIWQSGMWMLLYALIIAVAAALVTLLASRVAAQFGRDLRSAVFQKVVHFSSREFNHFSTASLITRCTNDIQQIQMLVVMLLRIVIYAPILGIGALVKVFETGDDMAWVIGVAIGLILALVLVLYFIAMPRFKKLQKLVDRVNLVAREILTGLPVIRAFSRERHEEERFDQANVALTKTNLFVNRVMTFMMPVMMFIMNGISILIVWVGAQAIDGGSMQVGNLMAFIQYTMQIIMAFLMLSMMSVMLPRALVSASRVAEVLQTEETVCDPQQPEPFKKEKSGFVEFENVCFHYPGAQEDVLKNISFTARPGQTTAFIGSTGSGKSTLVNLIPRFFDVTDGRILVNGTDIRKVKKQALRQDIGYVPQKGVLFSGTIESNIAYGLEKEDRKRVEQAAQVAQSADFISEKPNGYESEIAQGGTNVSGGQRQRLSIARAVAKDPKIYIFDDSFSALDYKTDAALRKALRNETKDSTILIVAQRISTVLHADQIIVLDDGEIAGIGTHQSLMDSCEVYRQIAESQLSKEELSNEQ
ncbi:MAG: ABC transporter ATP-binding protein [Acutalibacteraceae bacterium]|nr:ABC transporter ATP-binding protein [Acutalibacteraceae bacterium]